jgi:hypothetical protein
MTEAQKIQAALFKVVSNTGDQSSQPAPTKRQTSTESSGSQAPNKDGNTEQKQTDSQPQIKPGHAHGGSDVPSARGPPSGEQTVHKGVRPAGDGQQQNESSASITSINKTSDAPPSGVRHHNASANQMMTWLSCPVPSTSMVDQIEDGTGLNFRPLESIKFEESLDVSLQQVDIDFLESESDRSDVGQWGEMWVYYYLCKRYAAAIAEGQVKVIWLNQRCQSGAPFDIRLEQKFVTRDNETELENEQWIKTCIEVKATTAEEKNMFEISRQEVQAAVKFGERYHIYRVYNAGGKGSKVKLRILTDILTLMDTNAIKLCLFI